MIISEKKPLFSFEQGDCLNAIGKQWHPECFNCNSCGKLFGNSPFFLGIYLDPWILNVYRLLANFGFLMNNRYKFLEDGCPYCQLCWNDLFTTKCFACGFPVEAGDRWVRNITFPR